MPLASPDTHGWMCWWVDRLVDGWIHGWVVLWGVHLFWSCWPVI